MSLRLKWRDPAVIVIRRAVDKLHIATWPASSVHPVPRTGEFLVFGMDDTPTGYRVVRVVHQYGIKQVRNTPFHEGPTVVVDVEPYGGAVD